jgi:protein tyrosine phosphatase (PTP) superfamily phosphohydrolase (DUF442 family)
MKILRITLTVLILAFFLSTIVSLQAQQGAPAAPGQEKPKIPLPNYVELIPLIGTGGQPTDAGLKELVGKGYKAVLNIRTNDEEYDKVAEGKLVTQLGLQYIIIPFALADASEAQALAFHELMGALKDTKTFVHCASGNRVGGMIMIHQVLNGMDPEKAEQEARKAGMRSAAVLEYAKKVIASNKK